jgi:hypothetical protein
MNGAPSKKTAARVSLVLKAVGAGMSRSKAAALAGIAHQTIARWAAEDPQFGLDLAKAEAKEQMRLLERLDQVIEHPLPNTWQAIAWKLERRWPDEFGQKTRVDVNIDVQAEIRNMAEAAGLDPDLVMAQAEGILATASADTHRRINED